MTIKITTTKRIALAWPTVQKILIQHYVEMGVIPHDAPLVHIQDEFDNVLPVSVLLTWTLEEEHANG